MKKHQNKERGHAGEKIDSVTGRRIVAKHPEWELEKQTEGLTPSVEKAATQLEREMLKEAAHAKKMHKKSE